MATSIRYCDLLAAADVDAIINTVNCVGIMGKGIALQFKKKWPANFKAYELACKNQQVQLGKMFIYELGVLATPKYIINFPTKQHWRSASKLEHIRLGLEDLIQQMQQRGIQSVAIPPLGCGHGGLNWSDVLPLIEQAFLPYPELSACIYPPENQPNPQTISANTNTLPPNMTAGRAALLLLMDGYREIGYGLSRLETQKIAYFLQSSGYNLKLNFGKNQYGPYADNLRHVLDRMDGHFIRGVGDGVVASEIQPIPAAIQHAQQFLQQATPELMTHIQQVQKLISGYESAYGLELLSTVHWVATHESVATWQDVIPHVQAWNARKKQLMQPHHIQAAWQQLLDCGWIRQPQHTDQKQLHQDTP